MFIDSCNNIISIYFERKILLENNNNKFNKLYTVYINTIVLNKYTSYNDTIYHRKYIYHR